jgi:signal transduction histidine kinase
MSQHRAGPALSRHHLAMPGIRERDAGKRGKDARGGAPSAAPPTTFSAVARFVAGSMVAIAIVVVGGFFALRSIAIEEAERDIRERVQLQGRLVEAAGLSDGVLHGAPAALARLDYLVLGQILSESLMRVKIWTADGRILYSDQPALIGEHYRLGREERLLLRNGGAEAELSELSRPENRYERREGKLLEAYTPIRTPNGTQVLFEIYQRFGSVSTSGERLLRALAPPLLVGLTVLLLIQVPLAWSMARRLQRDHRDRERLLAGAVDASARERQRIAADLHDGVVQDLAGVAFGLAPLVEDADRRGAGEEASALRKAIARLRQGIRGLRTLLVEIHPPNLESAGLEAALDDLLSPLEADGISTELEVDEARPAGPGVDPLIYRVANEAIRNVRAHAGARKVRVSVTRAGQDSVRLLVEDDGRGIPEGARRERAGEGHLGLALLEDLAREAGGMLTVRSEPGRGTTVELEVPAR